MPPVGGWVGGPGRPVARHRCRAGHRPDRRPAWTWSVPSTPSRKPPTFGRVTADALDPRQRVALGVAALDRARRSGRDVAQSGAHLVDAADWNGVDVVICQKTIDMLTSNSYILIPDEQLCP